MSYYITLYHIISYYSIYIYIYAYIYIYMHICRASLHVKALGSRVLERRRRKPCKVRQRDVVRADVA